VGPARPVVMFSLGEQLQQVQEPLLALIGVHVLEHSEALRFSAVTGSTSFERSMAPKVAPYPVPRSDSSVPVEPAAGVSVRQDLVIRAHRFTTVLPAKVRTADDVFATQLHSRSGAIDAQLAVFV
jgi:hypothetical protein